MAKVAISTGHDLALLLLYFVDFKTTFSEANCNAVIQFLFNFQRLRGVIILTGLQTLSGLAVVFYSRIEAAGKQGQ
jgi:hypothetical protein